MTVVLTVQVKGVDETITRLRRAEAAGHASQREGVRALGEKHVKLLRDATPIGQGEDRGKRLRDSYDLTFAEGGATVGYRITNDTPYLRYVLKGRGPVVAKKRALRFVIGGKVFYRKRVGPARANRFDQPVRAQIQRDARALGLSIKTRVIAAAKP